MCGIIGCIGNTGSIDKKAVLAMLAHRGPDGEGQWQSPDGKVWLGHRRLAIIDLAGGVQPLSNEDGSIWIVFNGCIYNYLELAQGLRQKGHVFRTYSDTEVIVHAYEEYGEECLNEFIGMFAFALWDGRRQLMFCARDRMGVKPFYYWKGKQHFLFSSEIKAILKTGLVSVEVCPEAMSEYLVFQAMLGEKTLFQGVQMLLPGYSMTIDKEGVIQKKKQYWDLDFTPQRECDEEYCATHLHVLLNDAVKIRLRSDVALGAHLSGGLDSTAVVCLATDVKDTNDPLMTFTGSFREGEAYDETSHARLVAQKIGTQHHEVWVTADDFRKHIGKIIYFMDQPTAGPGVFPQYMVARKAAEKIKVVLGGQGGDELFAGYARYMVGYLEECLRGAIEETEDRTRYVATLQSLIPNLPMLKQYIPMLKFFLADGMFDSQEKRYFRLMDRSAGVRDIYNPELFSNGNVILEKFHAMFSGSNAQSFLNKMLYFDLKIHLPALLHVEDRTSMAWGLESRVPLLDHRIAEFMASIPPIVKFKGGQPKYLFRKAIKNVIPEEIFHRKDKMGFPVPLHQWIKGPLKEFTCDLLLSQRAKNRGILNMQTIQDAIQGEKDFGRTVWGALCVELWFRTFVDKSL